MRSYVPALAVGFEDLQKRIEAQARQEAAHKAKIEVRVAMKMKLISSGTYGGTERLDATNNITDVSSRAGDLAQADDSFPPLAERACQLAASHSDA